MPQSPNSNEQSSALVPVKDLAAAKHRLQPSIGNDRPGLTLAMLEDLLAALTDSREIARTVIVTADERVQGVGTEHGAHLVNEPAGGDMNAAIALGFRCIRDLYGGRVAIFPADLPLATGAEIDRLVGAARRATGRSGRAIAVCPSADRGGTNMLYLDSGLDFKFRYGPGSYRLHLQSAPGSITAHTVESELVALDLDERKDLEAFAEFCARHPEFKSTRTWQFLRERGYIEETAEGEKIQS